MWCRNVCFNEVRQKVVMAPFHFTFNYYDNVVLVCILFCEWYSIIFTMCSMYVVKINILYFMKYLFSLPVFQGEVSQLDSDITVFTQNGYKAFYLFVPCCCQQYTNFFFGWLISKYISTEIHKQLFFFFVKAFGNFAGIRVLLLNAMLSLFV